MHQFSISHKGQAHEFSVAEETTIGELRYLVAQMFNIEPDAQKLLLRGKLDDSTTVTSIPAHSRVVLVGTQRADLNKHHESIRLRKEGRANRQKYTAAAFRTSKPLEYTFRSFEPLTLPSSQAALELLHRLAHDEGVRQVMQKHKYSVGVLRELHPSERTILGYNRNRGEVIALRLRTDALDGFRDYLSIRQVLMHELAHMVWDEHDENFNKLNSQHCREVVELDWTRGRAVGAEYRRPVEAQVDGGALGKDGFVLGGRVPELPEDMDPRDARRELMYRALQKRTKKQ
ncbi:hypothetical protein GGI25_002008 [Coemansia spiralis]|uniref:WLM domain-containing protein n=2 Tax=Coemansia TaxID=4863 RepID=A0A9W8GBE3_9FUNG|nr:WLM domain-containing protein [Coemansia spiralis]KAJ1992675.1 hypothetical protein EDC05_002618 [Coemansia umbellata]KAJ2623264.1 hypothetical protein GGI26_002491 [Coemansia sp. RSA 1358]KAJ2678816.1 hypothetical protein GGI25_002008 [Coemansia spiralis]